MNKRISLSIKMAVVFNTIVCVLLLPDSDGSIEFCHRQVWDIAEKEKRDEEKKNCICSFLRDRMERKTASHCGAVYTLGTKKKTNSFLRADLGTGEIPLVICQCHWFSSVMLLSWVRRLSKSYELVKFHQDTLTM